jgi:hypothetical protein
MAVMRPLDVKPWPQMRELRSRVNRAGIVRVQGNGSPALAGGARDSVPSGLRGKQVTVRVYEWQIKVWYTNQCVETMPRLTGTKRYHINYRHVIDTLLRKPGGFRNYRYREELFPSAVFRQAWEALNQHLSPRRADIAYLRILKLAAGGLESDVAATLQALLCSKKGWDDQTVAEQVQPQLPVPPGLTQHNVNLSEYDRLLTREVCYEPA